VTEAGILAEHRDHTTWITLNRPYAMNALNSEVNAGLIGTLAHAADEPDVRAVVILGAGGRAFSAGADLKEVARFDAEGLDPDRGPGEGMGGSRAFAALRAFPKPLIAAIDGYCLAGGLEIATLCDVRVATEQSTFGLPEARLGLMPDPGLVELTRLIPLGEALHIQLTGRRLQAARAYDIGFVQYVVPDRIALLAMVEGLAADIALGSPLAVEAFKRVARQGHALPMETASRLRDESWDEIRLTEDRLEGPRAFAERRPANWKRR
jgi:enoyl-CoA hydratase/carnithine racemase